MTWTKSDTDRLRDIAEAKKNVLEKIKTKTKKQKNGCEFFTGGKGNFGYGCIGFSGKSYSTHRLIWILKNGEINNELMVLHKCGNPPCVNLEHLYLGNHRDNIMDAKRHGTWQIGEKCHRSKLKTKDVIKIKKLIASGIGNSVIAKKYSVTKECISRIKTGINWRHIKALSALEQGEK